MYFIYRVNFECVIFALRRVNIYCYIAGVVKINLNLFLHIYHVVYFCLIYPCPNFNPFNITEG